VLAPVRVSGSEQAWARESVQAWESAWVPEAALALAPVKALVSAWARVSERGSESAPAKGPLGRSTTNLLRRRST
jgi:hypothetical protein